MELPSASAHHGHESPVARWFVVHSNAVGHHDDHSNAVPNCADGHRDDPMNLSAERNFEDDRCSSANHDRDHHDHLGEDSRIVAAHHDGRRDHVNLVDLSSSIEVPKNEDGHHDDRRDHDYRHDRNSLSENPTSVAAHHELHPNGAHLNEDGRHDRDHHDHDHWNEAPNCAGGHHGGRRSLHEVKNSVDDRFRAGLNQGADPCRADPGRLLDEAYSNEDGRHDRDHHGHDHWNAAQNCADGHHGDPRNRLACRVLRRWNHVSRQWACHRNDRLLMEVGPSRIDHCHCLKAAVTGLHLGRCALP